MFTVQRAEQVTAALWRRPGQAVQEFPQSNRRQVGWYLNGLCLFCFWSHVCMWAQYKELCPFEGDSTRKVRGKETLLWCFIYQQNDFPQIKTCSILPVGLEQAACFLSWKLAAWSNNAPSQERGDVTSWTCGAFSLTAGSAWIICLQYLWHLNELTQLCHLYCYKCWNNR